MLVAAALLAASCTGGGSASGGGSSAPPAPPPSSGPPPDDALPDVTVGDTGFVTSDGTPVQLRGVAVHSIDPVVYERAPDLGANFVRLAVPWSDVQPRAPKGDDP